MIRGLLVFCDGQATGEVDSGVDGLSGEVTETRVKEGKRA
jgi:hypothetical protein